MNEKGNRLGRGGGYYDRFLAQAEGAFKMGFCYKEQVLEAVPTDLHDITMDAVATQNGVIDIGEKYKI